MTKINIVLKNQAGNPVDHASVVVRFVQGHSSSNSARPSAPPIELRSNQEGDARIPAIPQGKILVQVIAKGYPDLRPDLRRRPRRRRTLEITLNPPQQQYSSHQ